MRVTYAMSDPVSVSMESPMKGPKLDVERLSGILMTVHMCISAPRAVRPRSSTGVIDQGGSISEAGAVEETCS